MTELGKTLKEAREEKGLSLDDLQSITKIQKRYLVGIEEGNYSSMPGKFYVRAFIKQYAEAVGLEPELLFEQFSESIPTVHQQEGSQQLSRVQSKQSIPLENTNWLNALPRILVVIFIIGALAILWYFLPKALSGDSDSNGSNDNDRVIIEAPSDQSKPDKDKDSEKDSDKNSDQNSPDSNAEEEDTDQDREQQITAISHEGITTTYELKNAEQFKVSLAASGDTWVNMKNGAGKSFFNGLLKATQTQEVDFSAEDKVILVIGNTINTEVKVNGETVEYAIKPQDVVRQDVIITFIKE